ncbi:uncharacterized protein TNCV_5015291 [Trichonephila clavipes]|nr:uncharacterized protein TNCV_5015291 [Trichonephila clavipes]
MLYNICRKKTKTCSLFTQQADLRQSSSFDLGTYCTPNARIWSLENPHEVQRDSPKSNVLTAISRRKVYEPFVFEEPTVTGSAYLDARQLCLFPQLEESEPYNCIWHQDGAPSHWHLSERDGLNITVLDQLIFCKGSRNKAGSTWPLCSPDLTSWDFYL